MMQNPIDNSDESKLNFILELLEVNPEIKAQYEEYINLQKGEKTNFLSTENAVQFIMAQAGIYQSELEKPDLSDSDYYSYIPRHKGYIPHYEAMEHIAEDMLNELFDNFTHEMMERVKGGDTITALLQSIALYDACWRAEITDTDESLPDLSEYLSNLLRQTRSKIIEQLQTQVIPNHLPQSFIEALFEHYTKHYSDNDKYLRFFEPTLFAVVNNEPRAVAAEELIAKYKIDRNFLPCIIPRISNLKKDWAEYTRDAETFMESDSEVAMNLLNYYLNESEGDFIRIAQKLWNQNLYKHHTAQLYYENIDPQKTPQFYKEVVWFLAETEKTKEYYTVLRELLTEEEKDKFIAKNSWDCHFCAMILDIENRHEQLLKYVTENRDSWDFSEIIPYLYATHPVESFKLIRETIFDKLAEKRNRRQYQKIVALLVSAQNIKNQELNLHQLIVQLYHCKPNLPALRNEMENGMLMRREKIGI